MRVLQPSPDTGMPSLAGLAVRTRLLWPRSLPHAEMLPTVGASGGYYS